MSKPKNKKKKFITQNNNFINTNLINDLTYSFYYNMLKQVAISIFSWENVPGSINARYLEEILFFNGQCAFLFDDKLGYICTQCAPNRKS